MEPMPELTFGQRLKIHRERSGKTRAVVGGLIGRSAEWVKAVETGRILQPRLHMLDRIAHALKVDIAELVGDPGVRSDLVHGPFHPALPAVRDALNRYPLSTDVAAQPLAHLRFRLTTAWRARHRSSDHRTVLGALLPDLIRDAQHAALHYRGDDRRRAQALLAEVLGLSQMFLAYQPAAEVLWRVADRAMTAAHESDDPEALAQAGWFLGQVHRDAGDWDTAMAVTLDVSRALEPYVADGSDNLLALWGALQFEAAYTCARAGEEGRAWRYWDDADRVAQRLPPSFFQQQTSFSGAILAAHAVTVAVELQKPGEAMRHAGRLDAAAIPSRPRRSRHLIEVARAHHGRAEHAAAIGVLRQAYESAPETIRYNSFARHITMDLLKGPSAVRGDAHDLAVKVGLTA